MAIMVRRRPYTLIYARNVTMHMKSIDSKYDRLIREKMEEQLLFEPNVETRNRKPLRQPAPFGAQWEIRFGPDNRFRVLYEILHFLRKRELMLPVLAGGVGGRGFLLGTALFPESAKMFPSNTPVVRRYGDRHATAGGRHRPRADCGDHAV